MKLTYFDSLVIGEVRLLTDNEGDDEGDIEDFDIETQSEAPHIDSPSGFDVFIMMFGFNESEWNPGLVLQHDTQFVGELRPDNEDDFGNYDSFNDTVEPELKDKTIEIGHRQAGSWATLSLYWDFNFNIPNFIGDDFLYEATSSTTESKQPTNHSVTFYFTDSVYITYIKFIIFDHFGKNEITAIDYTPPVAEYSHYTAGTFKAIITEFDTKSMFSQMYVFGFRRQDEVPANYEPFLPPQDRTFANQPASDVPLTPMQRLQLLLMTQQATTPPPQSDDDDDDDETKEYVIRPEDMIPDHKPERASIPNGALENPRTVEQHLFAMLALLLWTVA